MPKTQPWLTDFSIAVGAEKFIVEDISSIPLVSIPINLWAKYLQTAAHLKYRFVAIWALDLVRDFGVTCALEFSGNYLLLRTSIDKQTKKISSATPYFPGANRLERHMHDMFGITFRDHPDARRWTRHQAWEENQFPLAKEFSAADKSNGSIIKPDCDYPFVKLNGDSVYEIPVGPVHAGIIEPGHFRFQVAGEDIFRLEERLGYVHKGIEKIAEGRNVNSLIKLSSRVSGDSVVAYSWATALACERAVPLAISDRIHFIRAIMAERERIANHLWDVAAICNDVGFSFAYFQLGRIRELILRNNAIIFGHRLLKDFIVPGGVVSDLTSNHIDLMQDEICLVQKELADIYPILEQNSSLHDRLKTTGVLPPDKALKLGVVGYAGRASGHKFDVRKNAPYAPYDRFEFNVPSFNTGDVLARVRIRTQEILISLKLLGDLLQQMPCGTVRVNWENPPKNSEGIGIVDGWRGEVLVYVRFGENGIIDRFFPRDPSWFSWLALEELIHGNIVPDFPVCNKSINGSYSGVDL